MPSIGNVQFPYTRRGVEQASVYQDLLSRAAAQAAQREQAARVQAAVAAPMTYDRGLHQLRQLPVRVVGDPRNPGVELDVPLQQDLGVRFAARPGWGGINLMGRF